MDARTGGFQAKGRKPNPINEESQKKAEEFFNELRQKGSVSAVEKVKLVDEYAEALARVIAEEGRSGDSQVRSFLEELWAVKSKIGKKNVSFESILPSIKIIKSKAAYKAARKSGRSNLIGENLKKLIFEGIDAVKSEEDFNAFFELYEAMYGYFYYYSKR